MKQVDKFDRPGVYKVTCNDCPVQYIGKTERSVRVRFQEHLKKSNSNVFKHIMETGHNINDLNKDVIVCKNSNDRLLLAATEKFEIIKAQNKGIPLANVQMDLDGPHNVLLERCCAL